MRLIGVICTLTKSPDPLSSEASPFSENRMPVEVFDRGVEGFRI